VQHVPFGMTLVDLLRPRTIVELGTYWGDSYCALCQAVAKLNLAGETRCVAVDTWEGDSHTGGYQGIYEDLRAHHDPLYGSFSTLLRTTFDDAARQTLDGSVDLLHIDGLHTYDAVKHDFETWRPKLSQRGVVLFHDTAERKEDFGVWKLWAELSPLHPSFEFEHGHGLGVLAVGPDLADGTRRFLDAANANSARLRQIYQALGTRAEFFTLASQLLTNVFGMIQLTNAKLRATGAAVDPFTEQISAAQQHPVEFAEYLRECLQQLLK
jgi:hypothetical protein